MENDIDLITKLVDNQQKTVEHLLDQNGQLINLLVSLTMPQVSSEHMKDTKVTGEAESDVALDGGSNDA